MTACFDKINKFAVGDSSTYVNFNLGNQLRGDISYQYSVIGSTKMGRCPTCLESFLLLVHTLDVA